jgi:hypothetical protein
MSVRVEGFKQVNSGISPPALPKWRATVDEDGQYCFAVPL